MNSQLVVVNKSFLDIAVIPRSLTSTWKPVEYCFETLPGVARLQLLPSCKHSKKMLRGLKWLRSAHNHSLNYARLVKTVPNMFAMWKHINLHTKATHCGHTINVFITDLSSCLFVNNFVILFFHTIEKYSSVYMHLLTGSSEFWSVRIPRNPSWK